MAQATAHMRKNVSIPLFFTAVLGTPLLGMAVGMLAGSRSGYSALVIPPATPPDVTFPIVWAALYVMMGLSLFFLLQRPATTQLLAHNRTVSVTLWGVQLGMNLLWQFAFFTLKWYVFSFLWLVALAAVNLAALLYAFRVHKLAGALLVPYEAWLLFAGYLSLFVALLN